jgi:hypothetical protein
MPDYHDPRNARRPETADPRTPLARAADSLPARFYMRADDSEPPAVTAARERWRAAEAEAKARRAARDEVLSEEAGDGGSPIAAPGEARDGAALDDAAGAARVRLVPGDGAAADVGGAGPAHGAAAPDQAAGPVGRCGGCGYLTTARGHEEACGG